MKSKKNIYKWKCPKCNREHQKIDIQKEGEAGVCDHCNETAKVVYHVEIID